MHVLIINSDSSDIDPLMGSLRALDCAVDVEMGVDQAAERVKRKAYDVIMISTSQTLDIPNHIQLLRRAARGYIYVVLLFDGMSASDIAETGANDSFGLNTDQKTIEDQLRNLNRLSGLIAQMGDDSKDYPSIGGIIGKSAFNQLFLSGIDRAGRNAEQSFLLSISVANFNDLFSLGGPSTTDYLVAGLSHKVSKLRRQSDIAGQVGPCEFTILLQRPAYETEPLEAAGRFVSMLQNFQDDLTGPSVPVFLDVSLVSIPSGALLFHETIDTQAVKARSEASGSSV